MSEEYVVSGLKYNVRFSAGDYISLCRSPTFVMNVSSFSTGKYN